MNSKSFAITAVTLAALVSGAAIAQDKGASIKGEKERCYGISMAGKTDDQGNAWKYVAKGTCTGMKTPTGTGSLKPI